MDALVGTGFVGGHLRRQRPFGAVFDSRTFGEAAGRSFDMLVCAAAPGSMFEASRAPGRDRARVDALIAGLSTVKARRFVLISTIAVLADFAGDETTAAFETTVPYGVNRRALELFVGETFAECLIVRLPALFGSGLRKNFLFDLLNPLPTMLTGDRLAALAGAAPLYRHDDATGLYVIDRHALDASGRRAELEAAAVAAGLAATGFTHPDSHFQYYNMSALWTDIERGLGAGVPVLHLAPAPLAAGHIFAAFNGYPMPASQARVHREDMHTRQAALWKRDGSYIADAEAVLDDVLAFLGAGEASW